MGWNDATRNERVHRVWRGQNRQRDEAVAVPHDHPVANHCGCRERLNDHQSKASPLSSLATGLLNRILKTLEQEMHVIQFVEQPIVVLKVEQGAVDAALHVVSPQESGGISRQLQR
jgi:hypothetical protein